MVTAEEVCQMQKVTLSIGGFAQSWLSSSVVTLSVGEKDEDRGVIVMITRRGRIENTFLVTEDKAIALSVQEALCGF